MIGDGEPELYELARRMREALERALWEPGESTDEVIARLNRMTMEISEIVPDDKVMAVLDHQPLGDTFIFSVGTRKSVDPRHSARHPSDRNLPHSEFVAQFQPLVAYYQEQVRIHLAALDGWLSGR